MRVSRWLGALLVGLAAAACVWAQQTEIEPLGLVALNSAERAYVAAHPVLTVAHVDVPLQPVMGWNADGQDEGVVADILTLVARRTGLKIQSLRAPTIAERDATFRSRRALLLPMVLEGSPVAAGTLLTDSYFKVETIYVTRRDQNDFTPSGNFGGLRVAVTTGSAYETFLRRRFPGARFVLQLNALAELRAVAEGRADVAVGQLPVAVYAIESHLLANLSIRAFAEGAPGAYSMAVPPDLPVLRDILNKALNSITPTELRVIVTKWAPTRHLLDLNAAQLLLNDAERAWVLARRSIRVTYDRDFSPFSMEHDRSMQGLGPDLLREAARRVGLDIVDELPGDWADAFAAVKAGRADVLVAAGRNDERSAVLRFVGPWSSSPTAIIAPRGVVGPLTLGDLSAAPVAVQEAHFLIPQIQRRYPALKLLLKPTLADALEAVRQGDAGAAIGNLQVMSQLIQRLHPGALTVAGEIVDGDSELFFAVPQAQPELAVVLGKGLESISQQDRSRLRQKWLSARYTPGWTIWQVLQILVPTLAGSLLIVLLVRRTNLRLQAEVVQRVEAQERLQASLQREQKASETKSAFIATLSHEIRNPMAAVVSAASLLQLRRLEPAERKLVSSIEQAGEGLLKLLTRILDLSKAESGMLSLRSEWVDPLDWCQRVCAAYVSSAAHKGLELNTQFDGLDGVQVEFDPIRFGQVLSNLLSNAVKFCDHGEVRVHLQLLNDPGRLHLTVSDTGVGMQASELPQLFEPYSQLPSTRSRHAEGSGLGLALCRQLVQQMGGNIAVHSEPGRGSRFEVELPAAWRRDSAGGAGEAGSLSIVSTLSPAPGLAPDWQHEPVIVVDDDPVTLMVTCEQLRSLGLEVLGFNSAEAALDSWVHAPVRLVITDCHMLGMDGYELTRQIRQRGAGSGHRPWIVALTGSSLADDHAQCLACGMDEVLVKPFRVDEWVARLKVPPDLSLRARPPEGE